MSDLEKGPVARNGHVILSSSELELVFVVRPFGKNIYRTQKIPASLDELPLHVFVGIYSDAAGHI